MILSLTQSMALTRPSQDHRCYPHVPFSIPIRTYHRICVRIPTGRSRSIPPFLTLSFASTLRSSDLPQFSSGVSISASSPPRLTFGPMSFASGTQSGSIRSACEAPVFLPADQVLQLEFVPNMSDSSLGTHENRSIEAELMKV